MLIVLSIPSSVGERASPAIVAEPVAANGSPMKAYSYRSFILDLGLCRTFHWILTITDVSKSIINAAAELVLEASSKSRAKFYPLLITPFGQTQ
ncbi:hypothetical protein ACTXT7_006835 [Hymenolepis weldensis]